MQRKFFGLIFLFGLLFIFEHTLTAQTARSVTVVTEPKAVVWIDGVRRGETDESGKLIVKPVTAGERILRVRAYGFKQYEKPLAATADGDVKIALEKTNDAAELAFQEAEKVLAEDQVKALELYQKAVSLRPEYPEAQVALARLETDLGNYDEALDAIAAARKARSLYPEATAVEGRIYKELGEYNKAIDTFDRAIKEGKGFQPEAYTGLALLFKDEAESAAADNDIEDEKFFYAEAAKNFEKAIEQLSATESVVYLFLGKIYEDTGQKKKAIAVYEKFLRDMPEHEEVPAVKSFIIQLNKPDVVQ
jgi:tetratricopeptide (TPR) repeat protein